MTDHEMLHDVTQMLDALRHGQEEIWESLLERVYPELKQIAQAHMRRENAGVTLQATALVHEAYLRLVGDRNREWEGRIHFFGAISAIMRRVLVDLARQHHAKKRGGAQKPVTMLTGMLGTEDRTDDVLAVHDALKKLEKTDPRQSRIVEMHFFCGMKMSEIASVLGLSERTIKREWRVARAWLRLELG